MPAAAQASKEFEEKTKVLINKLLRCEKLSQFDSYLYSKYADDLMGRQPEDGLQIKGILALLSDEYDKFDRLYHNAINISGFPATVKVNYIYLLVIYGNYELAEDLLREISDSPGGVIEANLLCQCLYCCHNMDNFDLAERFISLIKKTRSKLYDRIDTVISHYGCFVPENCPKLMQRYLDFVADDSIAEDSQEVWKSVDAFASEIESEHV